MKTIALITGPALGHIGRLYEVAKCLRRITSARIIFIGPDLSSYLDKVVGNDFETILLSIAQENSKAPFGDFADGLESVFSSHKFDLIVHDLCPLRWVSTTRFPDCARINVTNIFLTRMGTAPTFQAIWYDEIGERINRSRAEKDLPVVSSAYDLYEADRVLLADPLPLISRYGDLPAHYRACGSCVWSMDADMPAALSDVSDALILSMGSTGRGAFDVDLLQSIMRRTGCGVSIYVGKDADQMRDHGFIDHAYDWLPMDKVLGKARAVVSQGGTGSTYQALAKAIPVIVIPTHPNHRILGNILEEMGVGICVEPGTRQVKIDALDYGTMLANAVALAGEMAHQDGAVKIATEINELL